MQRASHSAGRPSQWTGTLADRGRAGRQQASHRLLPRRSSPQSWCPEGRVRLPQRCGLVSRLSAEESEAAHAGRGAILIEAESDSPLLLLRLYVFLVVCARVGFFEYPLIDFEVHSHR